MNDITVLIPTSPIPAHPSTAIIREVIASIRRHLPDSEIWILCDGVRPQVEHRREQYRQYLVELIEWVTAQSNIRTWTFGKHRQQAGMLKEVVPAITTPFLFFCEHDATIDDKSIDWRMMQSLLSIGLVNTIRLYWHETIHPEHVHLMGHCLRGTRGRDFVRTKQWSSWPHLSRVDFYQKILNQHFSQDDCRMVETVMYSPVLEADWKDYKTVIYAPEPDAVRFHHWDARRDPITGEKDAGDW